jgi:hypothetical protein
MNTPLVTPTVIKGKGTVGLAKMRKIEYDGARE